MRKPASFLSLFAVILVSLTAYQNCDNYIPEHGERIGASVDDMNFEGFKTTIYPIVQSNCSGCHGAFQNPMFAVADQQSAFETLLSQPNYYLNPSNPSQSRLVTKIAGSHSGIPIPVSAQLQTAITTWAAGIQ